MKYKVGDKVKIVSLQSEGRGCCMDVVGDIGEIIEYDSSNILKYKVKIEDGGRWWWEESNLELIEDTKPNTVKGETEVTTQSSNLKKGDIVIRTEFSYEDGRMIRGNHYIVHSCIGSYVYLEGVYDNEGELDRFNVDNFDLVKSYEEKRNCRNMKPTDLITISVDGIESKVPLGDIVHAVTILGVTNGHYGLDIWRALRKPFDCEGFVQNKDTVVEFRDKQKEALDYFFQSYYDKQQQEKDELKTLIEDKMKEVDALVKQLNQM